MIAVEARDLIGQGSDIADARARPAARTHAPTPAPCPRCVRLAVVDALAIKTPAAERLGSSVPDMFNNLGVQVPYTI